MVPQVTQAPPATFPPSTNIQYANNIPQSQMYPPQYQQSVQCPTSPFPAVAQPQHMPYGARVNGQRPPQPQTAHPTQEHQGIGSSVKHFIKKNKGKLAIGAGIGGALLAGLVGADIGDGISNMCEGGGEGCFDGLGTSEGCDSAAYAGEGDYAAAGGDAVGGYADPAASGYVYDQAMPADCSNVMAQQQANFQHDQMMQADMHRQNMMNLI